MLLQRAREVVRTVAEARGDEVERGSVGRPDRGQQRLTARQRDGRGWQTLARVGVVRVVAQQVARVDGAVVVLAEPIHYGRIGLQPHAFAQAVDEYAGDDR